MDNMQAAPGQHIDKGPLMIGAHGTVDVKFQEAEPFQRDVLRVEAFKGGHNCVCWFKGGIKLLAAFLEAVISSICSFEFAIQMDRGHVVALARSEHVCERRRKMQRPCLLEPRRLTLLAFRVPLRRL